MKKAVKVLVATLLLLTFSTSSSALADMKYVYSEHGKLYTIYPELENGFYMNAGTDIIGNLPPLDILDSLTNKKIKGSITYPNYDNMRLGVWDLKWVFTPDNTDTYETLTGTIRLNIGVPEPETLDEFTTPSLTASTVQLNTMTTYDINLNDKVSGSTYKWTSSDTNVVEVNAKSGLLKAKKEGKATVTCEITLPDQTIKKLTSEVTVGFDDNAPVLTETELDLEPGDVIDINLENKVAKAKYRWASSDRSIAKVNSANGKVTAVAPGTAYVTCTITTPENQVIVLRCDISVTAPTTVTK